MDVRPVTTRDFDLNPYSPDEARVAKFFSKLGIGGGDDPIGALLASHAMLAAERKSPANGEVDRLRRGLQMIAAMEYEVGYSAETFAQAVLNGDEPLTSGHEPEREG